MKGIRICGECANYSYKKHKCLLGCNKKTDPRSKFYDDCPLPDVVEVIRCRDCHWWQKHKYSRVRGWCALRGAHSTDIWYCANGHKREDNENENNNNND